MVAVGAEVFISGYAAFKISCRDENEKPLYQRELSRLYKNLI